MSLFTSLNTSVSGLSAGAESLTVIANNLANTNTVGYKRQRTLFASMASSGSNLTGVAGSGGVDTSTQRMQSVQGMLQTTTNTTDLALSGPGFMPVAEGTNTEDGLFYIRSASFAQDKDGYMVDTDGNYLLGWETDGVGNTIPPQTLEPVRVGNRISAQATNNIAIGMNLKADEVIHTFDTTSSLAANLDQIMANPSLSDFNMDATVYDAQGTQRNISFAFVKKAENVWSYMAHTAGENLVGGTPGQNTLINSGEIYFEESGALKHVTDTDFDVTWAGGVPIESLNVDFGPQDGGIIFDNASVTGSLNFTDHVLAMTYNDEHPNKPATELGTYTVNATGGNVLELVEPDGTTHTATVPTSAEKRVIDFGNGIELTVSENWSYPGVGPVGTIDTQLVDGVNSESFEGVVQFSADYNPFLLEQDGFTSGTLNAINVDEEGYIEGFFTNGQSKKLWQVPIAVFRAPHELGPVEGNRFRSTVDSGEPFFKVAAAGDTAEVVSSSLEASTVDVATEFSLMVTSQRVYQANSKVMQTSDQMLNELMNIR